MICSCCIRSSEFLFLRTYTRVFFSDSREKIAHTCFLACSLWYRQEWASFSFSQQNFVLVQPRTSPPKICNMFFKIRSNLKRTWRRCCARSRWCSGRCGGAGSGSGTRRRARPSRRRRRRRPIGKISAECCSFSAVSAPIFASKNIPALRAKQGYTQRRAAPSW